jgi:hypothetical protein
VRAVLSSATAIWNVQPQPWLSSRLHPPHIDLPSLDNDSVGGSRESVLLHYATYLVAGITKVNIYTLVIVKIPHNCRILTI